MKTMTVTAIISAALLLFSGCGSSEKKDAADSAAAAETAAVAEAPQQDSQTPAHEEHEATVQAQTAMLEGLLSENGGADEEMLRKCCTKNALQQLKDAYEYDDSDGDKLAVWAISGKDYSDTVMKLESVKKEGPNTYRATFRAYAGDEPRETCVMEYSLALENGEWKIDRYTRVSYK